MDGTTQLIEIDRRYLLHPLHHPDDHKTPFFIERGEGAELIAADGRRVVDGLAGLWNVNIGHGRAELADAAAATSDGRTALFPPATATADLTSAKTVAPPTAARGLPVEKAKNDKK